MKRTYAVVVPILLIACAATRPVQDLAAGERPALDSDEAGLWMWSDHWEEDLSTSGLVVSDPGLNAYVREVACRVAQDYCGDIRVYVLEIPHFNASVYPNGMMVVWTGLLLRVQNEAQLAAVLGHEIAHYQRRHSITGWRDARNKAAMFTWGQILLYASGVPGAPLIDLAGQIAFFGSIFKFSRDHEREADRLGLELMAAAGYDPAEAPVIWEALIEEQEAEDESQPFIFISTHPHSDERAATLKQLAAEQLSETNANVTEQDRYVEQLLPLRGTLLEDELAQRRFPSTDLILERLRQTNAAPGEIEFFQGELYRLRGDSGDAERAGEHYRRALTLGGAPAEAYRSLGLVSRRVGDDAGACDAFRRYLELEPEADDRAMIEAFLAMRP